jgi:hypothetical protein
MLTLTGRILALLGGRASRSDAGATASSSNVHVDFRASGVYISNKFCTSVADVPDDGGGGAVWNVQKQ